MRISVKVCLGVLSAVALVAAGTPALAAPEVSTRRLGGPDRYATATAIARASGSFVTAVVVRGDAFADALAAANVGGPTLLTARDNLPAPTADLIRERNLHSATILGTADVVSDRVFRQVEQLGVEVTRVGGRDRYETSAATYYRDYNAEAAQPQEVDGMRTAILSSGLAYADALAAAPISAVELVPLLLTAPDHLPAPIKQVLLDDPAGFGSIEQVVIVGGPAVVSGSVVRELQGMGITVRRIFGTNRQQTAVRIFEFAEQEFGWRLTHVNLARGDAFADSLAGTWHAGREEAPILLTVTPTQLGSVTREFLRSRLATITSIDVFGSRAAVSDEVVADARQAATTQPPAP